jgi:glutamate N-acetyltransferase/amino-acid N-acetyltransferase
VGIAKGAGMIHPNMATMLAFLLTDATLPPRPKTLLEHVSDQSFHRLSVDGDTSPNDTVLLWGSGASAPRPPVSLESDLCLVARDLCRRIAVDGEGATRLVTIEVRGAPSESDAVLVGRTIATSPLTKTAVHGRDPNWGRILAAAGRSGITFDAERARVWIGPATVYDQGRPQPENENAAHLHAEREGGRARHRPRGRHGLRSGVDVRLLRRLRAHQRGLSLLSRSSMQGSPRPPRAGIANFSKSRSLAGRPSRQMG